MSRTLRSATVLLLLSVPLVGCFDSEDPKKVELVDNTKKPDGNGTNTIAEADFIALQEEVAALKSKLSSVERDAKSAKSGVSSLQVDVAAHESELNTVANGLNSLSSSTARQLWLYDGNGTKKHKVISIDDKNGYQVAIVEIFAGVNANYRINVPSYTNSQQTPLPLESVGSDYLTKGVPGIRYANAGCSGEAVIPDGESGADHGQAGAIGTYLAWIDEAATRRTAFSYNSAYSGSGTCSNVTSTLSSGRLASTSPLSSYSYPNPLTVGP